MPIKDKGFPDNIQIIVSALFNLFCGALLATGYHLTFQLPAEDARVMAGIVQYPKDNVYYLLHANAWSLMNQSGAVALKCGITEETLSILLCALGGAFSFTALGLIALAWAGNVYFSLLIPLFMYYFGLVGISSANYPIYLMGTMYTQGIIGLFFGLLTIGFCSCNRVKTAAFIAGIAVCVHPTIGLFYLISFALFLLFIKSHLGAAEIKGILKALTAGILISMISLIMQKLSYAVEMPAADTETVSLLLHKCLQNFSWHRSPGSKIWLSEATFAAMIPAVLAVIELKRKASSGKSFFAAAALCAISVVALFFMTADSILDSDYVNLFMTWRYLNILNVCFIPVTLGILGRVGHSRDWQSIALLFGLVIFSLTTKNIDSSTSYVLFGLAAGWILFATKRMASAKLKWTKNAIAGVLLAAGSAIIIYPAAIRVIKGDYDKSIFDNYKQNIDYEVLSNRPNLLLISSDCGLIQTRIKRPILIGPNDLESHIYFPKTLPRFNHILSRVYGLDLMTTLPNSGIHNTWMTREHRTLWESRSLAEWLKIREEFGVTDIVTSPGWALKLPIVIKSDNFTLFAIQ